ncbi:hypothetical protein CT0861_03966 [Colletotrichum tofieldiae]|uniref:Uncharacterized protein n=1 Tax=Colletotrichum tofieldiae TaxID=708197 RepID=A0A161VDK5_9PEZI|nr:hypothetical protein CT0861_03966 [Colletotrichum tofieldiae]
MAQAQRRNHQRRPQSTPSPDEDDCHIQLLLSDVNDKSSLQVYTAQVSDAFLDKLARPRLPPPSQASVLIRHTETSYEPLSSFQERLLQATFPRGQERKRGRDAGVDDAGDDAVEGDYVPSAGPAKKSRTPNRITNTSR